MLPRHASSGSVTWSPAPRRHRCGHPAVPQQTHRPQALGDALRTAADVATVAGILLGLRNSLLAKSIKPSSPETEEADGVQWGVMSIVSCLPWFNPLAWVFAGLNDEDRRKTYVAFAAVYSVPLLTHGLSFDPFVILCTLAAAGHVQADRIAQTEPETFQSLGLDRVAQSLQLPQKTSTSLKDALQQQLPPDARQRPAEDTQELSDFDKRLNKPRR